MRCKKRKKVERDVVRFYIIHENVFFFTYAVLLCGKGNMWPAELPLPDSLL